MSSTTYEAICACDGDGLIYFGVGADATHFAKPEGPPLTIALTTRTPALTVYQGVLRMVLADQDGNIIHTSYDADNQGWLPPNQNNQTLATYKTYSNGGYATPAMVALDDLWVFFVDQNRLVQVAKFDGQAWGTPVQVAIEGAWLDKMTEDTPSFTIADGQLLMCMADTDGYPGLYYCADPTGKNLQNWLPIRGCLPSGISTYHNRTPTIYDWQGNLYMLLLDSDSHVMFASWKSGSYGLTTPQRIFPDDGWKSDFSPSLYSVKDQLGACLCDRQGRVYFTSYQNQAWVPVTDPYTPWDDWTSVNNSPPRLHSWVQSQATPSASNWMSGLAPSLSLAKVSIPGTHESLTYAASTGDLEVRCQSAPLLAQLQAGIRYFDLRLRAVAGAHPPEFEVWHGIVNLDLNFSDLYNQARSFLATASTEALIFCIKDNDDGHDPTLFGDTLAHFVNESQHTWFTDPTVPTVSEARGKIVLFRRFANPPDRTWGIDLTTGWDNNSPYDTVDAGKGGKFYIQDDYEWNLLNVWDKFDRISSMMEKTVARSMGAGFYINLTNASTGAFPLTFATLINPRLADLIATTETGRTKPVFLGVVAMDFFHEDTATTIAFSNFAPSGLQPAG